MIDKYNKLELIMNSIIMAIILIIIAVFFWPNDEDNSQSNKFDKNKIQIKIIVKRINIREGPTIESKDLGDVYQEEIYTVLDHVDKKDYYWYKITTNQGLTGYVASDPNNPYVEIINGTIDRTPPDISTDKEFLLFNNGEVSYNDILCVDDYSSCNITYDNSDSRYITYIGTDEDGNESRLRVRYYNVYDTYSTYYEFNKYVNAIYNKKEDNNKIIIEAVYELNKEILSENKSISYTPIINLYDEYFNEVKGINIEYNTNELDINCINNNELILKDEYLEENLLEKSKLCINYQIEDIDNKVKYFAVGFTGVENYTKDENYFANYYSKYYINNN